MNHDAEVTTPDDDRLCDGLAKRLFFITMAGVIAYVAVVIVLMSSID